MEEGKRCSTACYVAWNSGQTAGGLLFFFFFFFLSCSTLCVIHRPIYSERRRDKWLQYMYGVSEWEDIQVRLYFIQCWATQSCEIPVSPCLLALQDYKYIHCRLRERQKSLPYHQLGEGWNTDLHKQFSCFVFLLHPWSGEKMQILLLANRDRKTDTWLTTNMQIVLFL